MIVQTLVYQAVVCLMFVTAYQAIRIPRNPAEYQINNPCSATGGVCADITDCCSRDDVCLKAPYNPMDPDSSRTGRNGRCVTIQVSNQQSLTLSGQSCTDSHQCKDRCCRELSGLRSRYFSCGVPYDEFAYTCISPALENNLPGDV